MTLTPQSPVLFRELYERAERIVLVTHIQPDGDALGSEYALGSFLQSKGKQPRIINHDPVSETLSFIADDRFEIELYDPQCHDSVLEEADLIILAGLDPVELIRKPWAYSVPVLDIAEVRHDKHYLSPDQGLYGPVSASIHELAAPLSRSDWTVGDIAHHRAAFFDAMAFPERPTITPVAVVKAAVEAFAGPDPTGATGVPRLAVDAGAHMFSAIAFWPAQAPRDVLISNGLATMGFALPAAIGAALARPGEPVLALAGDGGVSMTLGELETVARLDLPITVVVFNDAALSLIEIKQQTHHGGDRAVRFAPVDYAAIARASGLAGFVVTSGDELADVIAAEGDWRQPRLIDARIDPAPYHHLIDVTRG